jgi:hypothetical protein
MISFGESFPAEDNALIKAVYLHDQWTGAWATNRLPMIMPIIEQTRGALKEKPRWEDARDAAHTIAMVYSNLVHNEFIATHLSRYGYTTIDKFRRNGRAELGEHFTELCRELDRFDIYTQFLFFGHDGQKHGELFAIECPGHVIDFIDHNALKYAVIGSGHDMAMASLRWPPPLNFMLENTIYRLLEAKFSAETAAGVGKTTTVALRNREGHLIDVLEKSKAVNEARGER